MTADALQSPSGPRGPEVLARGFWLPGEQMQWLVSMRGITGVEVTLAVGDISLEGDRQVVAVRSQATTAGIVGLVKPYFEEAITTVDSTMGSPIWRQATERHGQTETVIESSFSAGAVQHRQTDNGGSPRTWNQAMPAGEPIYDNQTILGVVRAWNPSKSGARAYFFAVTDQLLHKHVVEFHGYDVLRTRLGLHNALHYRVAVYPAQGHAVGEQRSDQTYELWIADDYARLPLLLAVPHRYGRVSMELVRYTRPHPNGEGTLVRGAD